MRKRKACQLENDIVITDRATGDIERPTRHMPPSNRVPDSPNMNWVRKGRSQLGQKGGSWEAAAKRHVWETEILTVFKAADKNQNGFLTRAEIIRELRSNKKIGALLHLPSNISSLGESQARFEEAFQKMDIDNNKKIEPDEFLIFCAELHPE